MMTERQAMVVDDHPTNRLIAMALLRKAGWQVQEADSGEAALKLAQNTTFELILLDISMPGLSGEETCTRLRASASGQSATIIAYTAHAFPEDRTRLLGGGFDEVLVKPINRQQLETMVAEL